MAIRFSEIMAGVKCKKENILFSVAISNVFGGIFDGKYIKI
jgi:hypothetical protein